MKHSHLQALLRVRQYDQRLVSDGIDILPDIFEQVFGHFGMGWLIRHPDQKYRDIISMQISIMQIKKFTQINVLINKVFRKTYINCSIRIDLFTSILLLNIAQGQNKMSKKAHVVNINFTDHLKARSIDEFLETDRKQFSALSSFNLQGLMSSSRSIEDIYEIIKIIKEEPASFEKLMGATMGQQKPSQQNINLQSPLQTQEQVVLNVDTIFPYEADQLTSQIDIQPQVELQANQKDTIRSYKSIQMQRAQSINIKSQESSHSNLFNNISKTQFIQESKHEFSKAASVDQNMQGPIFERNQLHQNDGVLGNKHSTIQNSHVGAKAQVDGSKNEHYFYLIPAKYKSLLATILKEFISYKLTLARKTPSVSSKVVSRQVDKRKNITAKLTRKTVNYLHTKKQSQMNSTAQIFNKRITMTQNIHNPVSSFQTTPFQQRSTNTPSKSLMKFPLASTMTVNQKESVNKQSSQSLRTHLNGTLQLEKQISLKNKRIIFLESQVSQYQQKVKEKNHEIKDLINRQGITKKQCKYEVERIMRGKILCDINQKFQQNYSIDPTKQSNDKTLARSGSSSPNILQLNGKKYIRPQQMNIFSSQYSSNFITSNSNYSNNLKESTENELLRPVGQNVHPNAKNSDNMQHEKENLLKKKNRFLKRDSYRGALSSSVSYNKNDIVKLSRWYEQLSKQISKYQSQRDSLLDKLAENNVRVEKHLEKVEVLINSRKAQIQDCLKEINKIRDYIC